eukprot:740750-Prymnesium_polylepis.1
MLTSAEGRARLAACRRHTCGSRLGGPQPLCAGTSRRPYDREATGMAIDGRWLMMSPGAVSGRYARPA